MNKILGFATGLLFTIQALLANYVGLYGTIDFDVNSDRIIEGTLNSVGFGIGTSQPSTNLQVAGNALVSQQMFIGSGNGSSNLNVNGTFGVKVKTVSANATLGAESYVMADTSSSNIILTLPNAGTESGKIFSIKKISPSNSLHINGGGSLFEDGSGSFEVVSSSNLACFRFISDGSSWLTLDSYLGSETEAIKNYPMKIKIRTTNPGSTSNQFVLPLASGYSYNLTVSWGDGSSNVITAYNDAALTHTYGASGDYIVKILENPEGGYGGLKFNNGGDRQKLLELQAWGSVNWKTFYMAFYGCNVMNITATDQATAKTGKATSFASAWNNCRSLTGPFPALNSSNVTNFDSAWRDCLQLTGPFPVLDSSKVTTFWGAWYNCTSLTGPFPALNSSNVDDFQRAWANCRSLTGPFPALDSSKVTQFFISWQNCTALTGPFPALNSSNVTTISSAWQSSGITGIGSLDLRKITDGTLAFSGVTLPSADWSNLLVNLASNYSSDNVTLHGGSSVRNAAGNTAAATLSGNGWTITDGTP